MPEISPVYDFFSFFTKCAWKAAAPTLEMLAGAAAWSCGELRAETESLPLAGGAGGGGVPAAEAMPMLGAAARCRERRGQ